jgi:hypothetical protein
MGKGYKDVPCVYCALRVAVTADHVIARGFFPKDNRSGLPKVPACYECNNDKSKLEHSLTAIMPFGARHAGAGAAIAMTEPKLANNRKFHSNLAAGMIYSMRSVNGGARLPEMTIPVDHRDIERLCEFIVKGLVRHHWKVALGPDQFVRASFLSEAVRQRFDLFFEGAARAKVQHDYGNGVFAYEGMQSQECPELTLWKMSIYGAEVGGDQRQPGERSSVVYGISVPRISPATEMLLQDWSDPIN